MPPGSSPRNPSFEDPTSPAAALALKWSPWGFPLLYLGWAFLFWIPVLRSDTSVWSGWNLVLFLVGGASPLLAGAGLAALTGGREHVVDLGRRLIAVRPIPGRWWLLLLTFWLGFDLVMAAAAVMFGVTSTPLEPDWALLADPGPLAFLVVLSFVLPAVEEVGLRGYYLDRLRERFHITTAALINGATWAIWHAPFVAFPGYYANTTFDPDLSWWLPMIVLDTVLIVWVYERTGRSILAALIFHGMMNLTGEMLGISADMYPFVLVGHALAAGAVIFWWWRRALAAGSRWSTSDGRGTVGARNHGQPVPGSG